MYTTYISISLWENLTNGIELNCTHEIGNNCDPMVIAVLKGKWIGMEAV